MGPPHTNPQQVTLVCCAYRISGKVYSSWKDKEYIAAWAHWDVWTWDVGVQFMSGLFPWRYIVQFELYRISLSL